MKFKQVLPNYKIEYKKYPFWLKSEGKHHVFFYFKNSQAAKDIYTIMKRQELSFQKIKNFLELKQPKKKIIYYLYPGKQIKKRLMGDDWYAQAIYNEFCIHAIYNNKVNPLGPHEDTHLLSLPLGLSIGFYQEGLAEFLAGKNWFGESHRNCVIEGIKKGCQLSPLQYMDHQSWLNIPDDLAHYYYSLAGSFTEFIIKQYGKNKFKIFYKLINRDNNSRKNCLIFLRVFGISVDDAEKRWQDKIKKFPCVKK